jgi:hypothetical protein
VGVPVLVCHAVRRIRAVWPRSFIYAVKPSKIAIVRRDSDSQQGSVEDGRGVVVFVY